MIQSDRMRGTQPMHITNNRLSPPAWNDGQCFASIAPFKRRIGTADPGRRHCRHRTSFNRGTTALAIADRTSHRPEQKETVVASTVLNTSVDGNLTRYLREISKFPMLSLQEEVALSHLWRDRNDLGAAHKLVTSHLRLVAKIAMGYRGYGLPVGDLISEGSVGMMEAVKRYDPERGFRLATYAMWWIRAAIQEYILHSWSLVKMGTTAA